jgi:hypothetical protein
MWYHIEIMKKKQQRFSADGQKRPTCDSRDEGTNPGPVGECC